MYDPLNYFHSVVEQVVNVNPDFGSKTTSTMKRNMLFNVSQRNDILQYEESDLLWMND